MRTKRLVLGKDWKQGKIVIKEYKIPKNCYLQSVDCTEDKVHLTFVEIIYIDTEKKA